jgi:hypothetical protein
MMGEHAADRKFWAGIEVAVMVPVTRYVYWSQETSCPYQHPPEAALAVRPMNNCRMLSRKPYGLVAALEFGASQLTFGKAQPSWAVRSIRFTASN